VKEYTLGADEQFDIALRNEIPLSVWRTFTVTPGSEFDNQDVGFTVTPGNDYDVYILYDESLEFQSFGIGKGAVFNLKAGTYYLAFNPDMNTMGEKVLTSGIVD